MLKFVKTIKKRLWQNIENQLFIQPLGLTGVRD